MIMPPQNSQLQTWAETIKKEIPEYVILYPKTDDEVDLHLPDTDAVYGWVSPEKLPLAKNMRWLQSPAAGPAAGFYYPELIEHPVVVCNPRGIYNDHIAQHILMFVLALARGLPSYLDAQRAGIWDSNSRKSEYIDLAEATALIVGVGGIGHETAKLCTTFGMRVIGVDQRWEYTMPDIEKHEPEELDTLLPLADFVIVTTPHTPETEGMWNRDRFKLMKETAYFINIGRGKTTKLDDLVDALENRIIAGCGLDVFEIEPLPVESPLWKMPNVLITPHIAVKDAKNISERHFEVLLENARLFAKGKPLKNVVDKAMWY